MQFFTKFLPIAAFGTAFVAAEGILFLTGNNACSGAGSNQFTSPDGPSGPCIEISGQNSAITTSLDEGCSFTVYSDSSCSNDATLVGLGDCEIHDNWNSFSYDC